MAELSTLAPADLRIDEENPRISQPNVGQNKALFALAKHLGSKLVALAADIAEHGLDPSSLMVVMESVDPGRYIVLDGNRRLAALRALENPESVKDALDASSLRKLRKASQKFQADPVESVNAVVVKDRAEASHWIELGHTGELFAGAAKLRWGADESARFRARSGTPEPPTQILDFLERRGDLTPELRREVPTSNLQRLINSPPVRSKLGWELRKKILYLTADEDSVAKANMHVLDDLTREGGISVDDIYTQAKRQKYADKLPSSVVVTPTVPSDLRVAVTSAGFSGGGGTTKANRKGRAKIGRKRDRLIPSDCTLNIGSSSIRLKEMEKELRKLSLEKYTNAISVLFRVFLELSVDVYLAKFVPSLPERTALAKKIRAAKDDLLTRKKIASKQANTVEKTAQGGSFLGASIDTMHEYVHNPFMSPAPSDLRSEWDSLQPFIAALWSA